MEVEAGHDGYLTDVQAQAGDDVPVGNVVALISETAEGTGRDVHDTPEEVVAAPEPDTTTGTEIAGQTVIMPALGMAQDTGLIVSWQKEPGAAVAADDVLFEVETDKSTMEVPAGHDGYLAAIYAQAGEDVPVGETVAVISAEKPDTPVSRSVADAPAPAAKGASEPATAAAPPEPGPASPRPAAPAPAHGRVLASPKARRLALEEGLDLARLAEAGHPQPYHVKDLEVLRGMGAAPSAGAAGGTAEMPSQITARVAAAPGEEFLAWIAHETGNTPSAATLWAALAGGAMRRATGAGGTRIVVELGSPHGPARQLADPDRARLSEPPEETDEAAPALVLRDLTTSAITGLRLPARAAPALSVGREAAISPSRSISPRRSSTRRRRSPS